MFILEMSAEVKYGFENHDDEFGLNSTGSRAG